MLQYRVVAATTLPKLKVADSRASIQPFPWDLNNGMDLFDDTKREAATTMLHEYSTAILVGRAGRADIIFADPKRTRSFLIPVDPEQADAAHKGKEQQLDVAKVAWALRARRPQALAIIAWGHRIFIWNPEMRALVGMLRGHGGRITSIAVHPTLPHIFATTSADCTTRIYDLNMHSADSTTAHPHWMGWAGSTTSSAAHGYDGEDAKGEGIGRCILTLTGGIYGGHAWDALGASFHPTLPLIATCGADHFVKIWRCVLSKDPSNEDKPLFSGRISTARIFSVAWISEDLLIAHAGATFMPRMSGSDRGTPECDQGDVQDQANSEPLEWDRTLPGSLEVIQWLGLERFFPGGRWDANTRSIASDFQLSSSYTTIARLALDEEKVANEWISNIGQQLGRQLFLVYPATAEVVLVDMTQMPPSTVLFDDERSKKRARVSDPKRLVKLVTHFVQRAVVAFAYSSIGELLILDDGGLLQRFRV
ncbi:Coatomer beta subunit [Mycena kentingensis (nom. inval.)]|nr:Coatomer beta subunit [Mycena kentingensis (nom. inval.)]